MNQYAAIRDSLAPQYQNLPTAQVERLVRGTLGDVSPEDVESFFGTLKNIGGAVTKALPSVLPVAGTVVGSAFGGPVGGFVGGQLGSLAGGAIGQATVPRPAQARWPGPIADPVAGAIAGPVVSTGAGPAPAAAQLLSVLNRPEVIQGLLGALLGGAGRGSVPVGGTQVPVGAIANLIGTLANRVAEQEGYWSAESGEAYSEYLMDSVGGFRCDPADPAQRAEVLLELFHQSMPESATNRVEDEQYDDTDDLYDAAEYEEMLNSPGYR